MLDENIIYINALNTIDLADIEENLLSKPFKAIVIVEKEISQNLRNEWVSWLVRSKCFCMMAWGHDSTKWDEDVDMACVMLSMDDNSSKDSSNTTERFILTSWHENETLEEAFELCLLDNQLENHDPMIVLLHFPVQNSSSKLIEKYMKIKRNSLSQSIKIQ